MRRRWLLLLLLALAVVLLSGCANLVDADQTQADPGAALRLTPGHPVGQTFVAHHDGLNGIDAWLRAEPGSQGQLRLHVKAGPADGPDLAVASLPVAATSAVAEAPAPQHFAFPPLPAANGRYFYAYLELDGQGAVQVGAAPGSAYRDGSLYLDHAPAPDGQLAFRLSYDRGLTLAGFLGQEANDLGLLALALVIYIVPGWAVVAWFWRGARLSWAESLGLGAGLGLAFYTLWLLATDIVGLHLGPYNVWLPVAAGAVALALRYTRSGLAGGRGARLAFDCWACSDALWPDMALVAVLALVFGIRLLVVHTLDAPSWGDSVQHAMIAQLFVDHGGLFSSWQPYVPYRTLSVHYGFSVYAAMLTWAAHIDSTQATLLAGQLINGLSILGLYPLANRLAGGKRWAGVAAVLAAGLLSPMPAYYVNWGRYAQLGAQAILPVALWLFVDALENEPLRWPAIVLAGVAAAGMTLNNYRLPYYYAIFALAWLACYGLSHWRLDWRRWLAHMLRLAPLGLVIFVLVQPYRSRLAGGNLDVLFTALLGQSSQLALVIADYQNWREIARYVPPALGLIAILAFLWSLWRRRWPVVAVGLWGIGLALLPASQLVHVPGASLINVFAILIGLYMPVAILAGWLAQEAIAWLAPRGRRIVPVAAAVVAVALAGWGAARQVGIVDRQFMMVNRPDVRAMSWIRQNTPADARFLVEGFSIWGGVSAVGSDAGWWIPLLARRANTLPPQYALVDETPIAKDYSRRVVALVNGLEFAGTPDAPEMVRALCSEGVTHVYIGQGQGAVGGSGKPLYRPEQLAASPLFHLAYHQDRVYVFALDRGACSQAIRR